jgi:ABC-type multidrug transport system fused ATPase/permease subunit
MMVAGPVAGGKSNLLKSILGDLTINQGNIVISKAKAYVPQTPWTALGTVRENILFGFPFDEERYRRVLYACALEPDLELMVDGDMTWIGERSGNLSGGQKQRIALARAAYSNADVYVLDSPLSAVDMYTCQHIFKHCIQNLMIAGGGTVVLATHQTELFSMSDHLCVMQNGEMVYNAKFDFDGVKHLFPSMAAESGEAALADEKEINENPKKHRPHIFPSESKKRDDQIKKPVIPRPSSKKLPAKVNQDEMKQNIYVWYLHKLTLTLFFAATMIFIIGQTMRVYSDVWISIWSTRKYADRGLTSDAFYAGMYVGLVLTFLSLAFARAFFFYFVGKVGANNIHDQAFSSALKAPMHFFHLTPIGKLLSFFSKDVDTIDDVLVDNLMMLQIFMWILVLAIALVAYNLILFLAIVAGLGVVYVYIVHVFIKSSVPVKKVSQEAISQVIAHTAETLSGLAVVRAFRQQDRFLTDNLVLQSRSTVVNFSVSNLALWLAFRVDIIGVLLVIACCILAILDEGLETAQAGLLVSNSFQILLFFSIMSRTMGEVHDNMGAVEQARIMCNLECETEPEHVVTVPDHWPSKGEISFEGVVMPYLPGKPPVLKGINFSIREGEKIGVVGRTGAGKSSLIVALYRLAEISEGTVEVDGIDCSTVSLNKLRSSMAIIPQEPVMFGGTLRSNLDPFNKHEDLEIMDVLYKCLLGPLVESNKDGLDAKVETLGSNYSLGTQQLVCLARAMLNPSRILLLDEATAALDSDTNNKVQLVLKKNFSDRTIFTIAHRLDTIIDSDRILAINAGVIAEFERPDILLDNPDSIFHELCMNTGRAMFDSLAAKARANAAARFG